MTAAAWEDAELEAARRRALVELEPSLVRRAAMRAARVVELARAALRALEDVAGRGPGKESP